MPQLMCCLLILLLLPACDMGVPTETKDEVAPDPLTPASATDDAGTASEPQVTPKTPADIACFH